MSLLRRRWVVYRFDALPPPNDLVGSVGWCWTRRGAERLRRRLGPSVREWDGEAHYFDVMRRSKRMHVKRTSKNVTSGRRMSSHGYPSSSRSARHLQPPPVGPAPGVR